MNKLIKRAITGLSISVLLNAACLQAAEVIAFQEDFETDGMDTRYTVENPSDDGANDFFARRQNLSNGARATGGTLSGDYFWTGRDIDGQGIAVGDLEKDEGRITFNAFSIANLGALTLVMEAAQGGDELEFDNAMMIDIKIDDGDWYTIGGFRGTGTNSPGRYFIGDESTVADPEEDRLTNNFATFEWPINRIGSTMQIRIKMNLNGSTEEYAFDNIRLLADDSLEFATPAFVQDNYNEGETPTMTVTLSNAAPAGGKTLSLASSNYDEVSVPETVTIPEGQVSVHVPVEIVADNTFDGDRLIVVTVFGEGVAPNETTVTVVNVDAKPSLVLNEFMTSVPGSLPEDLVGDANGDGVRNGSQDEFVEFVNTGNVDIDMSGWVVSDDKGPRHVIPDGTILKPERAIVIFAGGKPNGLFGGAIVQTASAGNFGYSDTGDVIVLSSGGAEVLSYDYTADFPGVYQSVTRNPDLTGEYALISDVLTDGTLYTPGTKLDGSPFGTFSNSITLEVDKSTMAEDEASPATATVTLENAAPSGGLLIEITTNGMDADNNPDEVNIPVSSITIPEGQTSGTFEIYAYNDGNLDGDVGITVVARAEETVPNLVNMTITDVAVNTYTVVINEALSSLGGTGLDTNGDGVVEQAIDDQFVEIVNASGMLVDLSGWKLYSYAESDVNGQLMVHEFPEGTYLNDQGSIVIFGGGDEATIQSQIGTLTSGAIAQVSNSGGIGVNLTTDDNGVIRLTNPYGYVIDEVIYEASLADQGQSITRQPDVTGDFSALHIPASAPAIMLASPGATASGQAFAGNGVVDMPMWAQYVLDANGFADTQGWMGWVYAGDAPMIYSYSLNNWLYMPEDIISDAGSWGYIFKK